MFARLEPAERRIARQLLTRLVHIADGEGAQTRRPVERDRLLRQVPDPGAGGRVLDAFIEARLVTADGASVEITHEALLRAWPRLREWIESDRSALVVRQRVSDAGAEWVRGGRDPSLLFRGARLAGVREWVERQEPSQLGPEEREFIAACEAEEERRGRAVRRQSRIRRALVITLAGCWRWRWRPGRWPSSSVRRRWTRGARRSRRPWRYGRGPWRRGSRRRPCCSRPPPTARRPPRRPGGRC
ncbi:hypothetical protein ACFSNO_27470 [Streptomyces cirratus]